MQLALSTLSLQAEVLYLLGQACLEVCSLLTSWSLVHAGCLSIVSPRCMKPSPAPCALATLLTTPWEKLLSVVVPVLRCGLAIVVCTGYGYSLAHTHSRVISTAYIHHLLRNVGATSTAICPQNNTNTTQPNRPRPVPLAPPNPKAQIPTFWLTVQTPA